MAWERQRLGYSPQKTAPKVNQRKDKNMLKEIATTIGIALIIIASAKMLAIGLEKQDRVDCYRLQKQAREYAPVFYTTESEDAMCKALGIRVYE